MINDQLLQYIEQERTKGVPDKKIHEALVHVGWEEKDIKKAFRKISKHDPKHKVKRKGIFVAIFGTIFSLLVIIAFLPAFLNLFTSDIKPFDDSDIRPQVVSIPDEENVYFDLVELDPVDPEGEYEYDDHEIFSEKVWDEAYAEDMTTLNRETFEILARAAEKPAFQDITTADPKDITPNMQYTDMNTWRSAARKSAVRAIHLARNGDVHEGLEEAFRLIGIGHKIQDSQNTEIGYLIGMAKKSLGFDAIHTILPFVSDNSEILRRYADEIDLYVDSKEGLVNTYKINYHLHAQVVDAIAEKNASALTYEFGEDVIPQVFFVSDLHGGYYFRPNETKLLLAENTREAIHHIRTSCKPIEEEFFSVTVYSNLPEYLIPLGYHIPLGHFLENSFGGTLFDLALAGRSHFPKRRCLSEFHAKATQVLLALRAYQIDTGEYPETLDGLVPEYLDVVPLDPFDTEPIRYVLEEKIVYSVGPNMEDLGGSEGDDWKDMENPTFRIEF